MSCLGTMRTRDARRRSARSADVADPSTSEATGDLRERREALVREHMESENRHDFDATLATFQHPRYELIATGDVYDGERVYFDQASILRQLGVAHDPASPAGRVTTLISHPLTIGRALLRARAARG
jgi:hypothetical protein